MRNLAASLAVAVAFSNLQAADRPVDFTRDIRPILAEKCFFCHGPNDKKVRGDLRLDLKESAFLKNDLGTAPIVPGKPEQSLLIERIHAKENFKRMPPPKFKKDLTDAEKKLLHDWIAQGAEYRGHWAFETPKKPAPPAVKQAGWSRHPFDRFILNRLEKEGLQPSPQANATTLLRRVSLDLTGLPPTPSEVDAFLREVETSSFETAYGKAVDRLLASPRYGEHMARYWLDAARYGDTHGLHLDNYREMWPFRDWVVRAFNGNLTFDRFLTEQVAGDLLPEPSLDQQVATGFLRCHVTTNEGGTIEEEFYVRNVVDRIDTNGTVFLGLSIGCARCHNHPYDPISSKEYYGLFAFFNNLDGRAMDGNNKVHPPVVRVASPEHLADLAKLEKEVAALQEKIRKTVAEVKYDLKKDQVADEGERGPRDFVWIDDALPAGAKQLADAAVNPAWNFVTKPEPVFRGERSAKLTASGLRQFVMHPASPGLRVGKGDKLFAHVYLDPKNPPKEIMLQWHTNAWRHRAYWGANVIPWGTDDSPERRKIGDLPEKGKWVRLEVDPAQVGIKPGEVIVGWACTQHDGTAWWDACGLHTQTPQQGGSFDSFAAWLRFQRGIAGKGLPKQLQAIVRLDPKKHNAKQTQQLLQHFLENAYTGTRDLLAPLRAELTRKEAEKQKLDKNLPTTLVFKEKAGEPRPSYLLKRGEYDQKGDQVPRMVPAVLPAFPKGATLDRLGFARWLTDPKHPLTARVAVNRFWQQVFGTGLVKTVEDFGTQGEFPSHPELLDWMAVTFVEDGWDVKKLMKRLVTSATYLQSSKVTKELLEKDPRNRLLARAPRFRLDAEVLRDQALLIGGLLIEKVGGPSVKPPQPDGLWYAVAYTSSNTARFKADIGPDKVHRRSLYTFLKRTAAPPQMTALDAPSREQCVVRRERTNTPLAALLLLNETQFVEAARNLAQRTLKNGGTDDAARLNYLFKQATARLPDAVETSILQSALADHRARYRADEKAAQALVRIGAVPPDPNLPPAELAAWTMLGNLVLNLDEVLTKN